MKKNRNEYVMITVTKDEKELIQSLAFMADLPVATYCRKVILAQAAMRGKNDE